LGDNGFSQITVWQLSRPAASSDNAADMVWPAYFRRVLGASAMFVMMRFPSGHPRERRKGVSFPA